MIDRLAPSPDDPPVGDGDFVVTPLAAPLYGFFSMLGPWLGGVGDVPEGGITVPGNVFLRRISMPLGNGV